MSSLKSAALSETLRGQSPIGKCHIEDPDCAANEEGVTDWHAIHKPEQHRSSKGGYRKWLQGWWSGATRAHEVGIVIG